MSSWSKAYPASSSSAGFLPAAHPRAPAHLPQSSRPPDRPQEHSQPYANLAPQVPYKEHKAHTLLAKEQAQRLALPHSAAASKASPPEPHHRSESPQDRDAKPHSSGQTKEQQQEQKQRSKSSTSWDTSNSVR